MPPASIAAGRGLTNAIARLCRRAVAGGITGFGSRLRHKYQVATERLRSRAIEEGRADDSPEAIRNRLRLYHELTELVVERYRIVGTEVAVDGEQTVDDVFASVQDALQGVVASR